MAAEDSPKRAGRRPSASAAGSGAREEIEVVARQQFADLGYERVSVRGVAREAGVDPKLIHHYFGGKEALFAAVVELPLTPGEVVAELRVPSEETLGHRLARIVIGMQGNALSRMTMLGVIRAATSQPRAAERIRALLTSRLLVPVARELEIDQPDLRAALVGSQVVGLMMARYVVKLPALARASDEEITELLAASLDAVLGSVITPAAGNSTAGS
ncbi:TetR family transcriptional regulator [Salinibacterium sp. NG253]|uniref:TetR/AcrR family transcriptional regulator n=1 Tax=Salinibacterium sp. NG253 TaxID=2792039 RepID=UPI0018CFC799|nr:TetR family transcriptional regulator [Salinibacterium sp. NG253]MBH0116059.1 TetR family transcriptional regulator [Salinibacterium sp. NG253]